MLFKKKSKARIKAEAKIKELRRQNRDLRRQLALYFALSFLLLLILLGVPFVVCLNLTFVFGRTVGESLLAAAIVGITLPFLLYEQMQRLADFGEKITSEYEMRKWLKRKGFKRSASNKLDDR